MSPLWFLGVIFCIPQKLPLGSTAGSHFLWDPCGIAPSVHAICQLAKLYLDELALGYAQGVDRKGVQSDTRGVTVHHEYNSMQHRKCSVTWHHS